MSLRREIGIISVYPRSGDSYGAHPSEWSKVKDAWMAGKSFIETKNIYGDALVIKLACVEAIQLSSPEGMERDRAESAEDRADDEIQGVG